METLRELLQSLAPVLYGGIGLLWLITLGQVWRAYRRLARAFFRVEREMAQMELWGGLARAGLLLIVGLGLWLLLGPGFPVLGPAAPSPTFTPTPSPTRPVPAFPSPDCASSTPYGASSNAHTCPVSFPLTVPFSHPEPNRSASPLPGSERAD
jgi:hypothetical protein